MEGNIIHHWGKIIGKINTQDLTMSQCHQSCTICPIMSMLQYTLASNQSLIVGDVILLDMSPHSLFYHGGKFLPDCFLPNLPIAWAEAFSADQDLQN